MGKIIAQHSGAVPSQNRVTKIFTVISEYYSHDNNSTIINRGREAVKPISVLD
jgi:hypothetical protein